MKWSTASNCQRKVVLPHAAAARGRRCRYASGICGTACCRHSVSWVVIRVLFMQKPQWSCKVSAIRMRAPGPTAEYRATGQPCGAHESHRAPIGDESKENSLYAQVSDIVAGGRKIQISERNARNRQPIEHLLLDGIAGRPRLLSPASTRTLAPRCQRPGLVVGCDLRATNDVRRKKLEMTRTFIYPPLASPAGNDSHATLAAR